MNLLIIFLTFALGLVFGVIFLFIYHSITIKNNRKVMEEFLRKVDSEQKESLGILTDTMKASFGDLSLKALTRASEEFMRLAKTKLEQEREFSAKELNEKKGLIDQQLDKMNSALENVKNIVQDFEKDRENKFGELSAHMKSLTNITGKLQEALANSKTRGQWGERMAEDVLRLAGFIENVNYTKQQKIAEFGSRPDFTFLLPKNLKLNMDVKFPLDNYLKFLNANSDIEKEKFKDNFLRDVRLKIKELTGRDYINIEQNTVSYVILFIPNEQIYTFINENDNSILDLGIQNKVVICSPVTLFAVLAVIRQAIDSFALEKTSSEILEILNAFRKQWIEFVKKMELVGKRIFDAQKEYESLVTTRKRQLERQLEKIDGVKLDKNIKNTDSNDSGNSEDFFRIEAEDLIKNQNEYKEQ